MNWPDRAAVAVFWKSSDIYRLLIVMMSKRTSEAWLASQ
jgi:hypothetical protein